MVEIVDTGKYKDHFKIFDLKLYDEYTVYDLIKLIINMQSKKGVIEISVDDKCISSASVVDGIMNSYPAINTKLFKVVNSVLYEDILDGSLRYIINATPINES